MVMRENTSNDKENICNDTPILIIYPPNEWGKPNTWLVGQPAGQIVFEEGTVRMHSAGQPDGPFFLKNVAGRLASQPCIWLPPFILGLYYWYWYMIGYMFLIMGCISLLWGVIEI